MLCWRETVPNIKKDCLEKDCTFIVWLLKDLIGGLLDKFYIRFETKKCVILIIWNDFDSITVVIKIFHLLSTCQTRVFFFNPGFLSRTFANHKIARLMDDISLSLLYHFQPLHEHLGISQTITAESSPLPIASSRTRTGFQAQIANH